MNKAVAETCGRTPIERWIRATHAPIPSTSAQLTYDRMVSQSGESLPVIYQGLDATKRSHWHDVALCSAFTEAMRGAWVVLDVGPGDGWPCLRIADRFPKIVGIDPSPRRVRTQQENAARLGIGNVVFLLMDVLSMSFDDATFDAVAAASSIEQSVDPARAVTELFRVLATGGRLDLVFEDYDQYFLESIGDETLWSQIDQNEVILFYQCMHKSPPQEVRYGLALDPERLRGTPAIHEAVHALSRGAATFENVEEGRVDVSRPAVIELPFFERINALIKEVHYFELQHHTSRSIDTLLTDAGFVDVRHLDARIPDCLALFDSASESGRLEILAQQMVPIGEIFGEMAVRRAVPGPGDFALARKPF